MAYAQNETMPCWPCCWDAGYGDPNSPTWKLTRCKPARGPPFLSRGIDAYMATWQTFFASSAKPVVFDFEDVEITAADDVAFATAVGHCINIERNGEKTNLKFRLTMGFRKHDGRWRIVHEHHSLPAID